MRSNFIQVTSYSVLILGAVFLAGSIYFISQTQYSMNQIIIQLAAGTTGMNALSNGQAPRQERLEQLDFDVRAQGNLLTFSNQRLHSELKPADGHFTFNEIISSDGTKIAYGELSNCAGQTHLYSNWNGLPKCEWDYSIKILYRETGSIVTAFSKNGDERNLAGTALIYHPHAWTKNDKNLVITWSNIGLGGSNGAPAEYSVLYLANNQIQELAHVSHQSFFSRDFGVVAYVSGDETENVCNSENKATPGAIVVADLNTGETKTLVSEKNTLYSIDSFNCDTNKIVYRYRRAENSGDCGYPDFSDPKKTVELAF